MYRSKNNNNTSGQHIQSDVVLWLAMKRGEGSVLRLVLRCVRAPGRLRVVWPRRSQSAVFRETGRHSTKRN